MVKKDSQWPIVAVLVAAMVVRVVIAQLYKGYPSDMSCFISWSDDVYARGLPAFYSPGYFCDYPPLYVYGLYFLGMLRQVLHIALYSPGHLVLIKTPALCADLAIAVLVYLLALKRFSRGAALAFASLCAFNPAMIINSALWGQVDSLFSLIVVLSLYFLDEKKYEASVVLYTLSVLFKPQALFILPLLFVFAIMSREKKGILWGILLSAGVFAAVVVPLSVTQGCGWFHKIYFTAVKEYPYTTLNAFNLYALIGVNAVSVKTRLFFMSYAAWAIVLSALLYALILYMYVRYRSEKNHFIFSALVFLSLFMVMVSMHERYSYYPMVLTLFGFITCGDRRLLLTWLLLSLTTFASMAVVYSGAVKNVFYLNAHDPLMLFCSLVNLVVLAGLFIINRDIHGKGKIIPMGHTCRHEQ